MRLVFNWTLPACSGTISKLYCSATNTNDAWNIEAHELNPTNPDQWLEGTQNRATSTEGVDWSYKGKIGGIWKSWGTAGGDYSATIVMIYHTPPLLDG